MLQGKFDYVTVTYYGQDREGFLVDVTNGVGTLAGMTSNTAFQMSDATIEVQVSGEKSFLPKKSPVPYIATATESIGGTLSVKVLASNARSSEYVGTFKTVEQCQDAVKKFGKVTWVTPYRFQKEVTAS